MMGTDLSYFEFGNRISSIMFLFFAAVIVFRLVLSFRHYIYNGDAGDFDCSLLGQAVEESTVLTKYIFTGYHPGAIIVDAMILFVFCLLVIPLWIVFVILGLLLLLASVMRKRIAHKQEFVSNLKGNQLREEDNE